MEDKILHLIFHHKGEFQETCYVGGVQTVVKGISADMFSFTVLMEHVKEDLQYSEIGGIYVNKGMESVGWQMVGNDAELDALVGKVKSGTHIDFYVDTVVDSKTEPLKQMQPHVIIRPRQNIYAAQKQIKRKYVTTHHLKQQQMNKKFVQVDKTAKLLTRKSPRLNKLQENREASVVKNSASAKRKLVLPYPSHADECMGDNQFEECSPPHPPPPPPLTPANKKFAMLVEDYNKGITEYEKLRATNIKQNNEVFIAMNLPTLAASMKSANMKKKGKERMQGDIEDYVPEPEEEHGDDNDSEFIAKKTKEVKKTKSLCGPTTRSRSNAAPKKDVVIDKEVNDAIHEEPVPIELPEPLVGQGTMDDFIAMRKCQRENAVKAAASKNPPEPAIPDNEDEEDHEAQVEVPKRFRGGTRMDRVHSRPFDKRVVIDMNKRFQPVSDDDTVVSELSNFLGTIAKRCVSLTYVSWRHVPKSLKDTMWTYVKQRYIIPEELKFWSMRTIQESWRGRKSRLKKAHYTPYDNDQDRLDNKPDDVPAETFMSLLEYWGDEIVQERARKNAESRRKVVDTHTAGPRCFSQVKHKMQKKMQQKMPDADVGEPSDGLVFVKTRKRREGRTYKTDPTVISYRIEKIKKNLTTSGEGLDELITDGKSHGSSWLIGRSVNPSKISATDPTKTYVQDLTSKIRESLVEEVEAKVNKRVQSEVDAQVNKKVQENLTYVLKKLGEANPNINIDLAEFCVTNSSENENGTPTTGGTSF